MGSMLGRRWRAGVVALDTGAAVGMPGLERFRLFDTISRLLRETAARRPVLVILDDLQWGDASSLLLLRFLAREIGEWPVAIIVTYRDVEVADGHPLSALLGELSGVCQHISLPGLGHAEVAELVRSLTGEPLKSGIDEALHRATGGNPFFVRELIYVYSVRKGCYHNRLMSRYRVVCER